MNDLETAKTSLLQKQLTLVIVKNEQVLYETQFHRISGFLTAIEQLKEKMAEAVVADKVVGKAVALLCVYSKVNSVYAETLSEAGREILEKNRIHVEWNVLVDVILDDKKQDLCPFEKEALNISDAKEAFEKFKQLQQKLRACK
jgi:hypothetical protein